MALITSGSNTPANQNGLLTSVDITREALRVLSGELNFVRNINRSYDGRYGVAGAKIGYTTNVRKPSKFTVGTDPTISAQSIVEEYVPVTIDSQYNVGISYTQADLTLSLDDFSSRFIAPAVKQIAAKIDSTGLAQVYKTVFNQVGTPGTAITDTTVFWATDEILSNFMTPVDMRVMLVNPKARRQAGQLVTTLFTPKLNDDAIVNNIGEAFGAEFFLSQYLPTHTVGAYGAGPVLVNGAGQSGATIAMDGLAASAVVLKKGDILTMNGVFAVNPMTGDPYSFLQQFVVTADVTSTAGGAASVPVYPALVATGATKTVSALPADNAPVTIAGASGTQYAINLCFHKDAFVFVSAPLSAEGSDSVVESDPETGLSMRYVKWYDGVSDKTLFRFDILGGFATLRPENSVRVITA